MQTEPERRWPQNWIIRNRFDLQNDFFRFSDEENIDLSLRNSDGEDAEEEQTNEADEKRRLERLEREKWMQGKYVKIRVFVTNSNLKIEMCRKWG